MKPLIFGCAFAAVTPVMAQQADTDPFQIPNANRFSLGARIGMNFDAIPYLHNQYGFWITVGIMLIIPVGMIWVFRKRGWF